MTEETARVAFIRRHVGVVAEIFSVSSQKPCFRRIDVRLPVIPPQEPALKSSSLNHVRVNDRKMLAPRRTLR